jgi:pimeloyl-ACP methyl ester carboxylesterase
MIRNCWQIAVRAADVVKGPFSARCSLYSFADPRIMSLNQYKNYSNNGDIMKKRSFIKHTGTGFLAATVASSKFFASGSAIAANIDSQSSYDQSGNRQLGPLKHIDAGVLNIAYYEAGPVDGPVVMLMHGFPYDIHAYVEVTSLLEKKGVRVIVPYLRGFAPTTFKSKSTMRSGEQAAMGADLVSLMDALKINRALVAGYDWGGRAACVVAALYPERCIGLVSVNSYLIQDIANAQIPGNPLQESRLWYQYYFQQERGRAGLTKNRRELTRLLWSQWSPHWNFDDATFQRAAAAFESPDFVAITVHSYRHRFGNEHGDPKYAEMQQRLSKMPAISVPTITIDGAGDGVIPATDGAQSARYFSGPRSHRVLPKVGHNLPQEAPREFAAAIIELLSSSNNLS